MSYLLRLFAFAVPYPTCKPAAIVRALCFRLKMTVHQQQRQEQKATADFSASLRNDKQGAGNDKTTATADPPPCDLSEQRRSPGTPVRRRM